MLIHSKELLMGGGKKEEVINIPVYGDMKSKPSDGDWYIEGGFPAWGVGNFYIEDPRWYYSYTPDTNKILAINGTLGNTGSSITTRDVDGKNTTHSYIDTVTVLGFAFCRYGTYYSSSRIWRVYYVSPKAIVGDEMLSNGDKNTLTNTNYLSTSDIAQFPYFQYNITYIYRG